MYQIVAMVSAASAGKDVFDTLNLGDELARWLRAECAENRTGVSAGNGTGVTAMAERSAKRYWECRDEFGQLNRLRQIYTQQMDGTSYREAFRLITNRSEGELNDFRTLTSRFEEIGRFQAFLTSYRDKLKDRPLSAVN